MLSWLRIISQSLFHNLSSSIPLTNQRLSHPFPLLYLQPSQIFHQEFLFHIWVVFPLKSLSFHYWINNKSCYILPKRNIRIYLEALLSMSS